MNEAKKTRVYARKIVPFFVLFSVVALRADLVLVSVGSGGVSSRAGDSGNRHEISN